MINYEGGGAVLENNEYKLENHGKVIKKMSLKGVEKYIAILVRFYSGYLFFFYLPNCVRVYPRLEKKDNNDWGR